MAKLADLKLKKDVIDNDIDPNTIPEQMGSRPPMLQPGPYVFRLPSLAALQDCWSDKPIETTIKDKAVQRIAANFRDGAELTVVQAPNKDLIGQQFRTRVTNVERARGKATDPNRKYASEFDYLLIALGEKTLPKTNQGYAEALMRHPNQTFAADVEISFFCNANKPIRVEDESGQLQTLNGEEGRELQNGCGTRYYQKDVQKNDEGLYDNRITCNCGATLYANEDLQRWRASKVE